MQRTAPRPQPEPAPPIRRAPSNFKSSVDRHRPSWRHHHQITAANFPAIDPSVQLGTLGSTAHALQWKSNGPHLGTAPVGAPQQHAAALSAIHSPMSGTPKLPQFTGLSTSSEGRSVFTLGLLLSLPSTSPGHPSPSATSNTSVTESKGPRGPNRSLQPRGRGPTKPPVRPPRALSPPAQRVRREQLQDLPAFQSARTGSGPPSGPPARIQASAPAALLQRSKCPRGSPGVSSEPAPASTAYRINKTNKRPAAQQSLIECRPSCPAARPCPLAIFSLQYRATYLYGEVDPVLLIHNCLRNMLLPQLCFPQHMIDQAATAALQARGLPVSKQPRWEDQLYVDPSKPDEGQAWEGCYVQETSQRGPSAYQD
ncbi:hypothetical protein NDU88_007654 [Pleurodeles waltl]|uniref:Uncharacterized protein n=1 Tax=Pleurodeles waltl TaxID=8319 RepID=A0AAV7RQ20_PLEWA|nr:hypothetical protein NDU88_007654 [Pleurodeles waltl]